MVYGFSSCGLLVILCRIYGLWVLIMGAQTFGYPVSVLWSTGSHHVGSNVGYPVSDLWSTGEPVDHRSETG
jgi:hypothetical protein